MRFEISSIDEKTAKKIKKYCIDKDITQGEWAEMAHRALVGNPPGNTGVRIVH